MKVFPLRRTHFAGLLIVQVLAVIGSSQVIERFLRLDCPIRAVLGLQCPGCGSTRCVQALGSGDLVAAMRHNPLLASGVAVTFLCFGMGVIAPQVVIGISSWFRVRHKQATWVIVGLITVFTLVRNMSGISIITAALHNVVGVLVS
jgi:hypothetical protein